MLSRYTPSIKIKMKIRIIESHPLVGKNAKFTTDEKKFILLLQQDDLLEKEVMRVRYNLHFPKEGFNIETQYDIEKIITPVQYNKVMKYAAYFMLLEYGYEIKLPAYWIQSFKQIILYSAVLPFINKTHEPFEAVIVKQDSEVMVTMKISEKIDIVQVAVELIKQGLPLLLDELPSVPRINKPLETVERDTLLADLKKDKSNQGVINEINKNPQLQKIIGFIEEDSLQPVRSRYEKKASSILKLSERKMLHLLMNEFKLDQ